MEKLKERANEYESIVSESLRNVSGENMSHEELYEVWRNALVENTKFVCAVTKMRERNDRRTAWWDEEVKAVVNEKRDKFLAWRKMRLLNEEENMMSPSER